MIPQLLIKLLLSLNGPAHFSSAKPGLNMCSFIHFFWSTLNAGIYRVQPLRLDLFLNVAKSMRLQECHKDPGSGGISDLAPSYLWT